MKRDKHYIRSVKEIAFERASKLESLRREALKLSGADRAKRFLEGLSAGIAGKFAAEWVASDLALDLQIVTQVIQDMGFVDLGEGWYCPKGESS